LTAAIVGIIARFLHRAESVLGLAMTSRALHRAVWSTRDAMLRMIHAARTPTPRDEAQIVRLVGSIGEGRRRLAGLTLDAGNFEGTGLQRAKFLASIRRTGQAEQIVQEHIAAKPDDGYGYQVLAAIQLQAGQWDGAIASADAARDRGYRADHFETTAGALLLKGDLQALRAIDGKVQDPTPSTDLVNAMVAHSLGDSALASEARERLSFPSHIAQFHAWRNGEGDADLVFGALEELFAENARLRLEKTSNVKHRRLLATSIHGNEQQLMEVANSPFMRHVWSDARWPIFLERMGVTPEQLDTIPFTIHLPSSTQGASPETKRP
jgi:hypothetical protein